MSYREHAIKEFKIAGWMNEDGTYADDGSTDPEDQFDFNMQRAICENILELLDVLAEQGHSGASFDYLMSHFERLARFKIITPLTGEEHEWNEPYNDEGDQQNNRCSSVFRDADGRAYDIDAVAYEDEYGNLYGKGGHKDKEITFPYKPPKHPKIIPYKRWWQIWRSKPE